MYGLLASETAQSTEALRWS